MALVKLANSNPQQEFPKPHADTLSKMTYFSDTNRPFIGESFHSVYFYLILV